MSEQAKLGPITIKRIIGDYKKFDEANPRFFDVIKIDYTNVPKTKEILNVYFLMYGLPGTPYEGGQYIGMIEHDPEYPRKAPDYYMLTPSGRYEINKKICLTNSKFHNYDWAPGAWNLVSILEGFSSVWHSEFQDDKTGIAHISHSTPDVISNFARESQSYNLNKLNKFYSQFKKVQTGFNPYSTATSTTIDSTPKSGGATI